MIIGREAGTSRARICDVVDETEWNHSRTVSQQPCIVVPGSGSDVTS
jgi:hypothetical protein